MEFGLGETADAIRDTTARFAADKIAPIAARIDADNEFPRELWPTEAEAREISSIAIMCAR